MKQEEQAKLAEAFKKMTGRPHRTKDELSALLKAINEYNQWKNQTNQKKSTLF